MNNINEMTKVMNMPLSKAMKSIGKAEGVSFRESTLMYKLWQKCIKDEALVGL
jgi:hypothetical protein